MLMNKHWCTSVCPRGFANVHTLGQRERLFIRRNVPKSSTLWYFHNRCSQARIKQHSGAVKEGYYERCTGNPTHRRYASCFLTDGSDECRIRTRCAGIKHHGGDPNPPMDAWYSKNSTFTHVFDNRAVYEPPHYREIIALGRHALYSKRKGECEIHICTIIRQNSLYNKRQWLTSAK